MSKNKENKSDAHGKVGFLGKADSYFHSRLNPVFYLSLFLLVFLSLLLFQANISIGGDDSYYIIRAQKLLQEGKFPSFQGPLYPLFLTPLVAIFGLNVPLLKLFSIILSALFLYIFYKVFKNRINDTVLVISLLTLSVNSFVIYYASQTYNEAFHLFIQVIFFYQFFRVYEKVKDGDADIKTQYKDWLLLGFTLFLLAISKNLGLVGIITVSGFFLIHKKWKAMLVSIASWLLFMLSFSGLKSLFFEAEVQISRQGMMLLYKDPYNFDKGKEDLAGFFNRFIENSNIYLSKNLMKIFNLRDAGVTDRIELLTIILAVVFIYGLVITFKRNKYVFFTASYMLITLASIFVVLQTRWDSDRLVFLVVPFFLVFLLYIIDDFIRRSKFKMLQPVFIMVIFLYLASSITVAGKDIDLIKLKKNLSGEKYLGYTPDWENFLKISEWAGKNLPENSYVGSRKAAMSSIYANGKKFHSISRVPSQDADTLLDQLQENGVTHVIMAKLRRNPKQKSEYTINTVRRYLYFIEQKYPGTFIPVYQQGQNDSEEARLFQINYNVRASRTYLP